MRTRLFLSMLLLPLIAAGLAYSQGEKKPRTVEDYRPRTLQELSTMLPDNFRKALDKSADGQVTRIVVHGELFPSRVKVVYGDVTRPLLDLKDTVIAQWANGFAGAPEFYTRSYQTEMLFTEGAESYWLAVRKDVLNREWKKGQTVELCVIKMGNVRVGDKLEPVLLVEQVIP